MLLPPCVSIQLNVNQASAASAAIIEERCDAILGEGRCQVTVGAPSAGKEADGCWTATVDAASDAPLVASVLLRDLGHPDRREVQRAVEFRQRDAPPDRWATMGLLIAALVTIEEHSATPPPDDSAERAKRERDAQRAAELLRATQPAPPATRTRVVIDLRAAGLLATGMMPGVVWGLRAEAAVGTSHFVGLARVSYLPNRSEAAPIEVQEGADFRLIAPGIGACWIGAGQGRLSARVCVGGDLNISTVKGFGVSVPAEHSVKWGALWAGIGAQLRLFSHAYLVAALEGTAGLERPSFTLDTGDFYSIPPFGAYASLGLAVPY